MSVKLTFCWLTRQQNARYLTVTGRWIVLNSSVPGKLSPAVEHGTIRAEPP